MVEQTEKMISRGDTAIEAIARLEGKMDSLINLQSAQTSSITALDTRIRAVELQLATMAGANTEHQRPPQWPPILAAIVSSIVAVITLGALMISYIDTHPSTIIEQTETVP